ncbi:MAG: Galactose/methyl galactoside import ATP-binding protein MglA [Alphaproteobacteria bacterium MarineAlpha5_Bin9]|nr:MAG: Galactose/methyl galactoside import ATP-binding protein MglA [Alphaproteobacteria bacterium MarineAlpha5_Bin9]|tara:strand:+ start:21310 stop:22830 length:1521 start_codon:yes stop_codon:yes gene_type:complete
MVSPILELKDINKSFGHVQANKNINLIINKGTIHGIIGENGAGKSTLMSIVYGLYQADSGTININGKNVKLKSPRDSIINGIGMVHQHFMLVENFTVLENIILGFEGELVFGKNLEKAKKNLRNICDTYKLNIDLNSKISDLSVGFRQRVEILKSLYRGAEILILDEPTGVLTPQEVDELFKILRSLRDEGKTIVLITHKLIEIMDLTTVVSVMRQGEIVGHTKTENTNKEKLAEMMVGRSVLLRLDKSFAKRGDVIFKVKNLTVKDDLGVTRVKNVDLEIHSGEILGIAGVTGNGQTELLEALSGIRKVDSGEILLEKIKISDSEKFLDPRQLKEKGLAHVPEDRQRMGLVTDFKAYENLIFGYHDQKSFSSSSILNHNDILAHSKKIMKEYDVRPQSPHLITSNFSGGNQQKIILSRELNENPKVLLVGQPTRGVDIGAIEFIHQRLIDMRDKGAAILLVSVELDEVLSLSDRILVMFDGGIVGEKINKNVTDRELGLLMAGVV